MASGNAGGRTIAQRKNRQAPNLGLTKSWGQAPICRGIRPSCVPSCDQEVVCPDCQFLHEQQFGAPADVNFLRHCRAIRDYVDLGTSPLFSPFVAAFLVAANGYVLDIDARSVSFLQSSGVLVIQNNRVSALDSQFNEKLIHALGQVAAAVEPQTVICSGSSVSLARYAILLQPNQDKAAIGSNILRTIACLMFPLGRRRIASARQLMVMFGLSPAEARLARALCHGETLDEYADAQGVKLPTVKTQLRAVFAKTQTDRQISLVHLIAAIPPLR